MAGQRSRSTNEGRDDSKIVFTNIEQQLERTSKINNAIHQKGKKDKMTTMNNMAFHQKREENDPLRLGHSVSRCRDSGKFAGP